MRLSSISCIFLAALALVNYDSIFIIGGSGLSIGRILLIISLVFYLGHVLTNKKDRIYKFPRHLTLLSAWLVYQYISILWSPLETENIKYLVNFTVNILILILAYMSTLIYKNQRQIIASIYLPTLILCVAELLFKWRPAASRQWDFTNEIVGGYSNPLFLGFILASLIFIFLGRTISSGSLGKNFKYILPILIISPFVGSRTLIILCTISIIAMFIFSFSSVNRIFVNLLYLSGGILFGYYAFTSLKLVELIPLQILDKFSTISQILTDDSERNDTSRFQIIDAAKEYIWNSPLYGHGLGSAEQILGGNAFLVQIGGINPHNWWLELLLNGGIISAFMFFTIILLNIYRIHNKLRVSNIEFKADYASALAYLTIFPILVVGPSSITNFAFPWILLGISLALAHTNFEEVEA